MSSNRMRTRERRRAREQQSRRQRQILLLAAVVVIAAVAVLAYVITSQPAEAPVSDAVFASYEGIPHSETDEGFPLLGDPAAPVQVSEISSFHSPSCGNFYRTITPSLINRVKAGDISFVYVPIFGTGGIPNGEGANRAALCAGEQDRFWEYHSALFEWQLTFANQAYASNRLASGVDNLGIDRAAWDNCMASGRPDEIITAANTLVSRTEGFRGTPSVLVDGVMVNATLPEIEAAIATALTSG
ncbi:MAG: thioredoxin domain-containing protein [Anaerolineae bacterium]|nr:thioredoxin domain-containing protein [Anaerolineae bacterium]